MNQTILLLILLAVAFVGLLLTLSTLGTTRRDDRSEESSPFAASTEGETRCPRCGMGNLWTDRTCISCGSDLPGT